jgi:hypothetical protein
MQPLIALLAQHPIAVSIAAAGLILVGGWLFTRKRPGARLNMSAKSGGVVVGGNNSGSINTSTPGDTLASVLGIIGAILAALGVLVALLAWLYPKAPVP